MIVPASAGAPDRRARKKAGNSPSVTPESPFTPSAGYPIKTYPIEERSMVPQTRASNGLVKVHEAFGSASVATGAAFRDLLTYRHSHHARRSSANRSPAPLHHRRDCRTSRPYQPAFQRWAHHVEGAF